MNMVRDAGGWLIGASTRRAGCRAMAVFFALAGGLMAGAARGEEPAEGFLEALRDHGYYDAALMYLDRIDGSDQIPAALQAELEFQRGVTLLQAATLVRDRRSRERMLNEAKTSLEHFLQTQPDSPKRLFARRQFVLLLREWANMKVEIAQRTDDPQLLKEAGELYQQMYATSVAAAEELKTELAGLTETYDPTTQREQIEYRDSLRGEYLLTLLRAAQSLEERADTQPQDSDLRKKLLDEAIERYADMYKKYGEYMAGLRARFYQARCMTKQGDVKGALQLLTGDLLLEDATLADADNRPQMRQLRTQSLLLAIQCWLDNKDYATVIAQATPWLDSMRPAESEETDWLQLRLQVARAHKLYADQVFEKNPRDDVIKSSREAARRLARAVARRPGEYQEDARWLLTEIPGGVAVAKVGEQKPPENFEEARVRATDAISEMQSAEYMLKIGPERLQKEQDPAVRKELQDNLAKAATTVESKRQEARQNLLLAMRLANQDTLLEDLNLVRRLLAYLYFVDGQYYDAVVMGEFIGRRYPGSDGARKGAQVALAAYQKLYELSPSETKEFETDHIVSLANYMVETWSGTPEAAEAINTLIPFLIRQGRIDKARQYVENIPVDSRERGAAELRIGEALWRDYLLGMQEVRQWQAEASEGGANAAELTAKIAARRGELQEVRQTALQILEAGVDRMKQAGFVNETVPCAVNSLAQIYVDIDQAGKAVALLDDPTIGVLPLIERDDPVMESAPLREQTYRVALSALVSALPKRSRRSSAATWWRIQDMIRQLRQQVGDAPEDQKRLVDIFYSLARGMELQLNLLEKAQDRRVLADGFQTFLEEVRSESNDLRVLNWVAESFTSLGNGLRDGAKLTDASKECFRKAVATYDQILSNGTKTALPPEVQRQLKFHKAIALRDAEQFEQSTQLLTDVLLVDNGILEYQKEAARTYQLWAADPSAGIKYLTAVRGTKEDEQAGVQAVWGWSRIAQIVQRNRKYRDDFYEARYNWALCEYRLALRLRKESNRKEYLQKAQDVVVFTHRLYPTLGGQKWYGKYNALLKDIQQAQGERAVGFARK